MSSVKMYTILLSGKEIILVSILLKAFISLLSVCEFLGVDCSSAIKIFDELRKKFDSIIIQSREI